MSRWAGAWLAVVTGLVGCTANSAVAPDRTAGPTADPSGGPTVGARATAAVDRRPNACVPGRGTPGDLDGDGVADVAVGVPTYSEVPGRDAGAVHLRYSSRSAGLIRPGDLDLPERTGVRLGTVVATADLNRDGCDDLVIGAPGASPGPERSGEVVVVFGSAGGLDPAGHLRIPHVLSRPDAPDTFGRALALQDRGSSFELWVGAPAARVGSVRGAGRIHHYTLRPGGRRGARLHVTVHATISQDTPGVPGHAEPDDHFGSRLATDGRAGVWVGVPGEDVGDAYNAGAVWRLRTGAAGRMLGAATWTQDSPGVAGAVEAEDRFGSSLAAARGRVAVGVPAETIGGRFQAGSVQEFAGRGQDARPVRDWSRGGPGVPGPARTRERFGSALAVGRGLLCPGSSDLAIGSPGTRVGERLDAGSVTLIGPVGSPCPARVLVQGQGLAGSAGWNEFTGAELARQRGSGAGPDRLLIGATGEDVGPGMLDGAVLALGDALLENGDRVDVLRGPATVGFQAYGRALAGSPG